MVGEGEVGEGFGVWTSRLCLLEGEVEESTGQRRMGVQLWQGGARWGKIRESAESAVEGH